MFDRQQFCYSEGLQKSSYFFLIISIGGIAGDIKARLLV